MGNLCSNSGGSREDEARTSLKPKNAVLSRAESAISADDRRTGNVGGSMIALDAPAQEVKILCLGAGDSGKSTFNRQMRFIYSTHKEKDKTSEVEKLKIREKIHSDMMVGMRALVQLVRRQACLDKLGMQLQPPSEAAADTLEAVQPKKVTPSGPCYDMSAELGSCLQQLWNDPVIRAAWAQRAELWPLLGVANSVEEIFYDSLEAYFDSCARIMEDTYVPDQMDMLKCRLMTTGIEETSISVDGTSFRLLDVGGQKSERRKWINFFDNCQVLLFFAPLCDYELQLKEDPSVNRMHDSLALFDQICNSHFFKDSIILLLLNKDDIFRERIRNKDLSVCFPDYTGGKDYDKAGDFIKRKFLAVNKNPKKQIYSNMTTATDTASIKVVFDSLQVLLASKADA
jgi:guanine nucleotide-binding protein G(i) subunit alpha